MRIFTIDALLILASWLIRLVPISTQQPPNCRISGVTMDFVNLWSSSDSCFKAFDKKCSGSLNLEDFRILCEALFHNSDGKPYELTDEWIKEVFQIFDKNCDNKIDREEFTCCWNKWIKTIVKPMSALLVIDVQNDFISGTLNISKCPAGQNGYDVIKPINDLLESVPFNTVVYSLDWHPKNHVSFIDNVSLRPLHESSPVNATSAKVFDEVIFEGKPPVPQKLWPRHCVQNTFGSQLHEDLKVLPNGIKIYKGADPDIDSYSAFWNNMKLSQTKLESELKERNITDVYVCGIAYDYCVGYTALHAIQAGYRTCIIDECTRGLDVPVIEKIKNEVIRGHGLIVNLSEVKLMVEGKDRKPELGYKLALELKKTYT